MILGLSFCSLAGATHIVGGEIYYEDLGGGDYLVTLKVYRDCGSTNTNGTGFDDLASVGVYQGSFLYTEMLMALSDAEVNYVPVVLENPCFVLPPDVCVEEAIYQDVIYLPESASGYTLVYQRCCRNPSIININVPEDSGATFTTDIPGTNLTQEENSCPVFNNFPPVALCAYAEFYFDHSATDPDGDYLLYEFCTPLLGGTPDAPAPAPPAPPPYNGVSWAAGFSEGYPITANPGFEIDAETGYITGTPTQPGQFVLGVCVSEYRNGILLSKTNRDFQFNVTVCDANIVAAIPEQTQFCDGLTFEFTNESTNADDFYWDFGDPFSDDDWSIDPEPTYTYSDTGTFQVTLIANPEWPCADTTTSWYTANPLVAPQISDPVFECVEGYTTFDFYAIGEFETAAYIWDFGDDIEPPPTTVSNPDPITLEGPGSFDISLTVFEDGCDSTVTITLDVPEDPVAAIAPQETFCDGLEFTFGNESENAESYVWHFNDPWFGSDSSTDFEPTWTYSDTGLIMVQLIAMAENTCPDTTFESFEIYTLLDPFFETPEAQCFDGHSFNFLAEGTVDASAVYTWEFGTLANPATSSSPSPTNITWSEPGTYEVTLTISENDCEKDFTDEITIIPNPQFGYYLFNEFGCPPHYASFIDTSYSEIPLYYNWDFGDGTGSTASDPVHIYQYPGTYDVSVTISTVNGCADSETFVTPNAVTVHPLPQAGIDVEPNTVNILEPTVTISSLAEGNVGCEYFVNDGGYLDECFGSYTFNDGGLFEITQIVTNQYGCRDTARAEVAVEGFMFYAPNAFTPDNDGVNDVWLPSTIGVTNYHMMIYDRWGEVIWESFDKDEPWLGQVHSGEHYAQDGIYLYHVIMSDLLLLPHEYQGHITLIR